MYFLLAVVWNLVINVYGETKITCQGDKMEIYCNENNVIDIISANYGRTSSTPCSSNNIPIKNTNCRADHAEDLVKHKCQGNQICVISASRDVFGDICYGTPKYLEVTYTCVPDPHGFLYGLTCAHTELTISCEKQKTIQISRANYGREINSICPDNSIGTADCYNERSTQIARDVCDNKQTCTLRADSDMFVDTDTCFDAYLWVKYSCVEDFLCTNGDYIPNGYVSDGYCDCSIIPRVYYICDDEVEFNNK